jgi:hypothetical protein
MRQVLGFMTLLVAALACAWGIVHELKRDHAPNDAAAFTYARGQLGAASVRLEQMHDILGSYVGVDRDLFVGMTIAYTRPDTYCIQLMREGGWYHVTGPRGEPDRGACTVA